MVDGGGREEGGGTAGKCNLWVVWFLMTIGSHVTAAVLPKIRC